MTTLGQRIKFFRNRANVSQFTIELAIGISPGSISRFENGNINPTKETLFKISNYLGLNLREYQYLDGVLSSPVSDEEIKQVKLLYNDYFQKENVFAYILDDRWRIISVSKYCALFFESDLENAQKSIVGKSLIEVILNETLGIKKFLISFDFENLLRNQLTKFYYDVGFINQEDELKNALKWINSYDYSKKIWKELKDNKLTNIHTIETRIITLNKNNKFIKLNYSREPIRQFRRFEIIEYSSL